MATRRGQALVELAVGKFAIALVVATVVSFTEFIVGGMDDMSEYRPKHSGDFKKYILE